MDNREDAVLDALYGAVAEPAKWGGALEAVAGLYDASGAALVFLDVSQPGIDLALGAGAWNSDAIARYNDFAIFDPAPAAFARQPRGVATSTDRMFTQGQLKSSLFYNEFFRPAGFVECAGGVLFAERGRFSLLGIHRGRDRRPFSDADLARIGLVMPHMRRAFQLRSAFMRARMEAAALAATADRLPMGAAAIAGGVGALHVNTALRAMAARRDGLKIDARGWLRAEARPADRRLVELQSGVLKEGAPGGTAAVPRAGDRRPYAVLVAPLPPGLGFGGAPGEPIRGALVLVHDPAAAVPELPQQLVQIFGLTAGAARLAAALAAGHDLRSYAARENLTLHTARFHLKSAFARMDVRSQAALVRAVVRAMAELALSGGR